MGCFCEGKTVDGSATLSVSLSSSRCWLPRTLALPQCTGYLKLDRAKTAVTCHVVSVVGFSGVHV